jgi:outer membrane protein OmpA-like peptidoglycan-associated protein
MKKISTIIVIIIVAFCFYKSNAQLVKTVVSVTGEVTNVTNNKPISTNVEILGGDGTRITKAKSNSLDGKYFVTGLTPGKTFEIRVAELDYMRQSIPLILPSTDKYLEYSKDITLIPKKIGTKIQIPVKLFEANKSNLKYGADLFLKDYVELLKLNPTVTVKIVSFPDANGDQTKNMELTKARAQSIKAFLENNGIDSKRILVDGSASTDPSFPPPTGKASKGKRYVGTNYFVIDGI